MGALKERIQGSPIGPLPITDLRVKGIYNAPEVTPLVRIGIYPGVVSYEEQQPLLTPDGGIVPENPKGQWSQLYAAGRLY